MLFKAMTATIILLLCMSTGHALNPCVTTDSTTTTTGTQPIPFDIIPSSRPPLVTMKKSGAADLGVTSAETASGWYVVDSEAPSRIEDGVPSSSRHQHEAYTVQFCTKVRKAALDSSSDDSQSRPQQQMNNNHHQYPSSWCDWESDGDISWGESSSSSTLDDEEGEGNSHGPMHRVRRTSNYYKYPSPASGVDDYYPYHDALKTTTTTAKSSLQQQVRRLRYINTSVPFFFLNGNATPSSTYSTSRKDEDHDGEVDSVGGDLTFLVSPNGFLAPVQDFPCAFFCPSYFTGKDECVDTSSGIMDNKNIRTLTHVGLPMIALYNTDLNPSYGIEPREVHRNDFIRVLEEVEETNQYSADSSSSTTRQRSSLIFYEEIPLWFSPFTPTTGESDESSSNQYFTLTAQVRVYDNGTIIMRYREIPTFPKATADARRTAQNITMHPEYPISLVSVGLYFSEDEVVDHVADVIITRDTTVSGEEKEERTKNRYKAMRRVSVPVVPPQWMRPVMAVPSPTSSSAQQNDEEEQLVPRWEYFYPVTRAELEQSIKDTDGATTLSYSAVRFDLVGGAEKPPPTAAKGTAGNSKKAMCSSFTDEIRCLRTSLSSSSSLGCVWCAGNHILRDAETTRIEGTCMDTRDSSILCPAYQRRKQQQQLSGDDDGISSLPSLLNPSYEVSLGHSSRSNVSSSPSNTTESFIDTALSIFRAYSSSLQQQRQQSKGEGVSSGKGDDNTAEEEKEEEDWDFSALHDLVVDRYTHKSMFLYIGTCPSKQLKSSPASTHEDGLLFSFHGNKLRSPYVQITDAGSALEFSFPSSSSSRLGSTNDNDNAGRFLARLSLLNFARLGDYQRWLFRKFGSWTLGCVSALGTDDDASTSSRDGMFMFVFEYNEGKAIEWAQEQLALLRNDRTLPWNPRSFYSLILPFRKLYILFNMETGEITVKTDSATDDDKRDEMYWYDWGTTTDKRGGHDFPPSRRFMFPFLSSGSGHGSEGGGGFQLSFILQPPTKGIGAALQEPLVSLNSARNANHKSVLLPPLLSTQIAMPWPVFTSSVSSSSSSFVLKYTPKMTDQGSSSAFCKLRCFNGGRCSLSLLSEPSCLCPKGFSGAQCEKCAPGHYSTFKHSSSSSSSSSGYHSSYTEQRGGQLIISHAPLLMSDSWKILHREGVTIRVQKWNNDNFK